MRIDFKHTFLYGVYKIFDAREGRTDKSRFRYFVTHSEWDPYREQLNSLGKSAKSATRLASPSKDADLKGNTLRVYTYLFKVQHSGIREAQRSLGFKSPSLAQYHLDKLVSMGLATKDDQTGDYFLAREVKIEALEQFLKIGTYIIPRFVLYSAILTVLFAYFALSSRLAITSASVWTFVFAIVGLVITWYETVRAWRRTP